MPKIATEFSLIIQSKVNRTGGFKTEQADLNSG